MPGFRCNLAFPMSERGRKFWCDFLPRRSSHVLFFYEDTLFTYQMVSVVKKRTTEKKKKKKEIEQIETKRVLISLSFEAANQIADHIFGILLSHGSKSDKLKQHSHLTIE